MHALEGGADMGPPLASMCVERQTAHFAIRCALALALSRCGFLTQPDVVRSTTPGCFSS